MVRKKVESIISLGDKDKLVVQKSLPLFSLWNSEMTLAEFKILDVYLSRIDSHKPEKRVVIFEKDELEQILGIKKINNKSLELRLQHLMGNVAKISDKDEKRGFRLVTLFEEAVAEKDDLGSWKIKLEATQKAMKYFFNIENLGYLRYKLRCIISLTSRYAYILFLYIEANRFRKSWKISLEELKVVLHCNEGEYAKEFRYFNRDVLKRVQKEIIEKTGCRYEYGAIKNGRSVVGIKFTVYSTKTTESLSGNSDTLFTINKELSDEIISELWLEPLKRFEFTNEQYDELFSILTTVPDSKLPEPQIPGCYDDIEMMRYHYIDQKVKELIRRDSQKRIENKFLYLLKMLKNDSKK
mgnify:CR=1 FL=1